MGAFESMAASYRDDERKKQESKLGLCASASSRRVRRMLRLSTKSGWTKRILIIHLYAVGTPSAHPTRTRVCRRALQLR